MEFFFFWSASVNGDDWGKGIRGKTRHEWLEPGWGQKALYRERIGWNTDRNRMRDRKVGIGSTTV